MNRINKFDIHLDILSKFFLIESKDSTGTNIIFPRILPTHNTRRRVLTRSMVEFLSTGSPSKYPIPSFFHRRESRFPMLSMLRVTSRRYPRQTECKCQKSREHRKGTRRTSPEGPIDAREPIRDREEERIALVMRLRTTPVFERERESMMVDGFIRIIFVLRFSNK